MAKFVIKRDGKKAPFRAAKIVSSIRGACKDAHVPAKRAKTVINKVSRAVLKSVAKRQTVKTTLLKKKLLSVLTKMEPMAAKAWRKYEQRRMARRRRRM